MAAQSYGKYICKATGGQIGNEKLPWRLGSHARLDAHYRTLTDHGHRAIVCLLHGRRTDADIALTDSADFAYMNAFSSGWFPNALKE